MHGSIHVIFSLPPKVDFELNPRHGMGRRPDVPDLVSADERIGSNRGLTDG